MGKQAEDAPAYRGAKTAYARSNDTIQVAVLSYTSPEGLKEVKFEMLL